MIKCRVQKTQPVLLLCVLLCPGHVAYADDVEISTKGGFKISSGEYTFQLGGRIQYDYNHAESDNNPGDDGNTFEARRARIYIKGNVGNHWEFKSQYSLKDSEFADLYIRYKGFGPVAVFIAGNQKMPFALEELSSSKDISLLERSAITERYAIGRDEGLTLAGKNSFLNSNYTIGLYTEHTDAVSSDDEELGFAGRYTVAPIQDKGSLLHLGISYKGLDNDNGFGLEVGIVYGTLHAQAEYFDAEENNADIDGYYIQVGYIFTGETRPYKNSVFKRVKPVQSSGAWEIVARYEDGDGDFSDIGLGTDNASAYTLGLNWYAHNNVRLGVNYTSGESDTDDNEGSALRARIQLTF